MKHEKNIMKNNSKITQFYKILTKLYCKISNYHKKLGYSAIVSLYVNEPY